MALGVAGCSPSSIASGGNDVTTGTQQFNAPLDASFTTTTAAWADIAAGHLDQPANTFWQLLVLPAGNARWSLVTPPGVADNGGLVSVQSGATLLTGFEPSALIHFSPLAATSDAGTHWSQGILSRALTDVPDALAASGDGDIAALIGKTGTSVVTSSGGLSPSWRPGVTIKELAASSAGRSCGVSALTALAYSPSGRLLVGATCDRPGKVGVFAASGSGWRLVGPTLPVGENDATTNVLRLRAGDNEVSALLAAHSTGGTALLGARFTDSTSWSTPSLLALAPTERLVSSGLSADGGLVVLLNDKGRTLIEVSGIGSGGWAGLPTPAARTAVIAFDASGNMDAIAVNGSKLNVFRLDTGSFSWYSIQSIQVPIQYGSSS